jgi:prolyl-tRNA editing enzyme YbaK/EbsC (Cys-tRNA(Pro) deacylase)
MLKPKNLQDFMDQNGIPGEILHLEAPTPTVEAAAQAVKAENDQIVKTLVFTIRGQPLAAIACGTEPVSRRKIAARFAVGRKRVKLASADQVLEITGYPAGAVPPFGHKTILPTLLDPRVLNYDEVYAGGGAENALVRLKSADILHITSAEIENLRDAPREAP